MASRPLYTIGHSTRTAAALIDLLHAHGIQTLVDVRTIPRSRHNPQFNRDALAEALTAPECWVERTRPARKRVNLRPYLRDLHLEGGFLLMELGVTPTGTARADDVLRLIGQYVTVSREPGLYLTPVPAQEASFSGSALFSYRLNWQTALFLGIGDDRERSPQDDLARTGRQVFLKLSYSFRR